MIPSHNYCPNCESYILINEQSGEILRLGCKRYACEVCGPKKAYKLKKAITNYLKNFKFIRLFTYTVRTTIFKDVRHWNKLSREVWRRYINNIRRNKLLTDSQRHFQYIKVVEFTKKGYIHFHVIQTHYLDWVVCYRAWNEAIAVVLGRSLVWSDNKIINCDQLGAVNIKGIANAKHATNYIVKYLVKSAKDVAEKSYTLMGVEVKRVRLWSKSERVSFFRKKEGCHGWRFTIVAREEINDLLNLYLLDISSPELSEKIIKSNKLVEEFA
jgi:hypothetical protein